MLNLLTIRTLSIYVLSIILSISLFLTLMINPSNLVTQAGSNTKEFMNYYVINLQDGSNLSDIQTLINDLIINSDKKSEVTYKLNSELETDNLILPITLEIKSGDTQIDIINKYKSTTKTTLEELKSSKSQTQLNSKIASTSTNTDSVYSLVSDNVNLLNLTKNLEVNELNTLANNIQLEASNIQINSIEIQTTDYDSFNNKLKKLADNQEIPVTNSQNINTELNKSNKIKSTSKAKFLQTTTKFENYLKAKKSEEDRQLTQSRQARPEFDKLANQKASDAEMDKLIAKWQWIPKNIEIPSLNESISEASIDQITETQISEISKEIVVKTENSKPDSNLSGNNTKKIITKEEVNPTLEKVSKDRTKNNKNQLKIKKDDTLKKNKKFSNIKTISKLKYTNPFYTSPEEEKANNQKIETERLQALEYERTHTHATTQEESKNFNSNSSSKSKTVKNNTDDIFTQIANNLFEGSINAEARGLNNSKDKQTIYLWDNEVKALDVPGSDSRLGAVQIQTYNRNNSSAQRWGLWNHTQEIRSEVADNRCLDIAGANYTDGARIQLWECYGGQNQKWFFDGTSLRSWSRPEFCLDVSAGAIWNEGSKIQLYTCNNTSAQRFVAGDYNWGSKFDVNINASRTYVPVPGLTGHAFISYWVNDKLVNTQSAWPGYDNYDSGNCSNSPQQIQFRRDNITTFFWFNHTNNICDNDAAFIDNNDDIASAIYDVGTYKSFKAKSINSGKRISDLYRFNSRYRHGITNAGRNNINYQILFGSGDNYNCASFSQKVWNDIMDDTGNYSNRIRYGDRVWTPSDVFDSI